MRNSVQRRTLVRLKEEERRDHGWWRDRTTRGKSVLIVYHVWLRYNFGAWAQCQHSVSEFAKPSGHSEKP